MSKSLIKNVDGIGIWVRDDTEDCIISKHIVVVASAIVTIFGIYVLVRGTVLQDNFIVGCGTGLLAYSLCVTYICTKVFMKPAYEVYPGSDSGIFIIKTTPEADQLAICRAAKEIEAQCHEIAAKRGELDRIAGNCK